MLQLSDPVFSVCAKITNDLLVARRTLHATTTTTYAEALAEAMRARQEGIVRALIEVGRKVR